MRQKKKSQKRKRHFYIYSPISINKTARQFPYKLMNENLRYQL